MRIGLLASQDIRLFLCVLAFITPYIVQVSYVLGDISIRLYAPLWAYGSFDFPIFRILSVDYLIIELPFGIVRLLFIQQVYLFMNHRTSFRKLVLYGIATEIPGTILGYISSYLSAHTAFYAPVPIVLFVGLFFAVRTPKKPPHWLDSE